jgi:hypothetical protein
MNEYIRGKVGAQDGQVERMGPVRMPKIMINCKHEGKNEVVPEEPGKIR